MEIRHKKPDVNYWQTYNFLQPQPTRPLLECDKNTIHVKTITVQSESATVVILNAMKDLNSAFALFNQSTKPKILM